MIRNHYSAKLSALDLEMIRHVPPGGNWKDIPETVPSKRLEQIRASYAAGKGSRSTYYGRLHPDNPAYTITTYFNRPGNGCFVHYDFAGGQHRLISHREAARLQSFPDNFVFVSSKGSICKQIGNAVPPLLAYQIALAFPGVGNFVDLFCGAGGLSLGFHWAGWNGLISNDIDRGFLETHTHNIGTQAILGNIVDDSVLNEIVNTTKEKSHPDTPCILLGGPPCQGFSTAGNARSMGDARNHLFKSYAKVLQSVQPDYFVFENVPGLLSMEGGKVLVMVKHTLAEAGYGIDVWKLNSENYGVPQRRQRILLIGTREGKERLSMPTPITQFKQQYCLTTSPQIFSVCESLDDLPPVQPGEDACSLPYRGEPSNVFQQFARGYITPAEYIERIRMGERK
jgi:DNA (cytosine-5)-methyltransferase 1